MRRYGIHLVGRGSGNIKTFLEIPNFAAFDSPDPTWVTQLHFRPNETDL